MLDTLWSQIFLVAAVAVGLFAFWKGDEPERFGMGSFLLAWMASMLLQMDVDLYRNWQAGLFTVDLAMLIVLVALSWRSRKTWPIWASALQLLVVTSHIVFLFNPKASMTAFYTVVNLAGYGILACIGIGTFWAWQERRAAGLE